MEYNNPKIDAYLLELFKGYYDDDVYMSNFFFRLLKSNDIEMLARVIIYMDSINNNDAFFLKAVKFVETQIFLSWRIELKKEYLGVLTKKLGVNVKNYLLALFNSNALKNKKGFDELRIAIIYSFSYLLDSEIVQFLKSISKKLMISKSLKQEALQSLERMKAVVASKQQGQ